MKTNELKTCAHCNSPARFDDRGPVHLLPFSVTCTGNTCGIRTPFARLPQVVVAIWNNRAPRPAIGVLPSIAGKSGAFSAPPSSARGLKEVLQFYNDRFHINRRSNDIDALRAFLEAL